MKVGPAPNVKPLRVFAGFFTVASRSLAPTATRSADRSTVRIRVWRYSGRSALCGLECADATSDRSGERKERFDMTTFTRISDSGSAAGAATHIKLQGLGFFSLTAVRTDAGSLKLINWSTGGPAVSRVSDSGNQAGAVSAIAVTRVRNRTITAVRDGSGNLKLNSWDDGLGTGPIRRLGDSGSQAGAASVIAVHPGYPNAELPGLRPSPTRHAAGLVCLGAPVGGVRP